MQQGIDIDRRIKEIYPETFRYQVQVHSAFDETQGVWRVRFTKGNYVMQTLLEKQDTDLLLSGKKCLSLTVELRQLVESLKILDSIPKLI